MTKLTKPTKPKKNNPLTYKEFFKKYYGKNTAAEILFGWFDYAKKHNIPAYEKTIGEVQVLNKESRDRAFSAQNRHKDYQSSGREKD